MLMTDAVQIVCPHCMAANTVPQPRLSDGPQCGRCHRPLFTGASLALNPASFDSQLTRSSLPLLVDFWAPWCGPCQSMTAHFEEAAARLEPYVRLAKVDTQAHAQLGARFAVRSIPTLILFRGGKELFRHSGALASDEIVRFAQQS